METIATTPATRSSAARRFGPAQVVAGLLLLFFCGQCLWLATRIPLSRAELLYATPDAAGLFPSAVPVVAPLPVEAALLPQWLGMGAHPWTARLPFIFFGIMLGASLWYVARRLYGNVGGYIALALYSFSPAGIVYAARVAPEVVVAWGAFGCIFTSIAVAHTLYAPREVVLWNRKRIVLLATSIALAAATRFVAVLVVPLGLAFMLYLAPHRRRAAVAIMGAACGLAAVIFAALHRFVWGNMAADILHSDLLHPRAQALFVPSVWKVIGQMIWQNGPGALLLLLSAAITFVLWRRCRYFGNLAPLLSAVVLLFVALLFPQGAGATFLVACFPLLFLFVAGVAADVLQSGWRMPALGVVLAAIVSQVCFSIAGLWAIR